MATNKNQHFVPKCYLRPFTLDSAGAAINLFNIDRRKFIEKAPVKHQCSGNYFYGENPGLERAFQATEQNYAVVLREVLTPGYRLTDNHRDLLRHFWLLQYLRTEAASKRAVAMAAGVRSVAGLTEAEYSLGIREAVLLAMEQFVEQMDVADDLKICLCRNRTAVPFVTSDDPAVLSNRWHLENARTRRESFGLCSAGNLLLMPLSPRVLCLGYDGDVYSVPHEHGWVDVRHPADVGALNQHQFLNCRANIFVHNTDHAEVVRSAYDDVAMLRPPARHRIHYAVRDYDEGELARYRVVDTAVEGNRHQEAMVHMETVHARPNAWPRQLRWRDNGKVFTNGTGVGYIRRAWVWRDLRNPFRQEAARP